MFWTWKINNISDFRYNKCLVRLTNKYIQIFEMLEWSDKNRVIKQARLDTAPMDCLTYFHLPHFPFFLALAYAWRHIQYLYSRIKSLKRLWFAARALGNELKMKWKRNKTRVQAGTAFLFRLFHLLHLFTEINDWMGMAFIIRTAG